MRAEYLILAGVCCIDPQAPIPAFIDAGSALVDASNVDEYLQATPGH